MAITMYSYARVLSVLALATVALSQQATTAPSKFHRIITIVLENQDDMNVLNNDYMWDLAHKGVYLSDLDAITHPSQPNYIALTAGALHGVDGDKNFDVDARNIVDLLDEKGVSWKSYAEGYPGGCFEDEGLQRYRRKHVPFLTFDNIRKNTTRCSNIVSEHEFWADYKAGTLPQYVFYTPDMDNNGHDTGLDYSARWLESFLEPLLKDTTLMENTLIVVTYDENEHYSIQNRIYTVFLGHGAKPGTVDSTKYTLYDMLRMVEDNYELNNLGLGDAHAQGNMLATYQNAPVTELKRPLTYAKRIVAIVVPLGGTFIIAIVLIAYLIVRRRRARMEMIKSDTDSSEMESESRLAISLVASEQV